MALINPAGPSFAHWTDNLGTFSSGTTYGTQYEAGLNSGTPADASPATLLSALSHDCEYLVLGFSGFGEAGVNSATLLDILYDPAGGTSWTELISDLLVGMLGATTNFASTSARLGIPLMYHFPLWLPAGSSIGVQAKTVHTGALTTPSRVVAMAAGGSRNPASWWCGQKVETVGTLNQTTCRGQAITPGASGSMAVGWSSLGSALSAAGGAVQFACQGEATGSISAGTSRIEFGLGDVPVGPPLYKGMGGAEDGAHWFAGPIFYDFPAGAQLQARAGSSKAVPGAQDVAAYVVQ